MLIASLALLTAGASRAVDAWPVLAVPPKVDTFMVGEQIISSGMPMRVRGFVSSDQGVLDLAEWFRNSLGQPLVEDRRGGKRILGRAQGGYYLTVQIEPAGKGSKGLLVVSDIKSMNEGSSRYASEVRQILGRWPSASQLLNHLVSEEGGRVITQITITNTHAEDLNRDVLVRLMAQDGLALERDATVEKSLAASVARDRHGGTALFFQGPGKQATAVITRDTQGRSTIVLQTIASLDAYKR